MIIMLIVIIFLVGLVSLSNAQNPYCYRTYEDPCYGADPTADYIDGDLISPGLPEDSDGNRRRRGATANEQFLWTNGMIYYTIANGYSDDEIATIYSAMHHIENKTCIRFQKKADNTEDYINIFPGIGCCSYIGYIGCGRQGVSLAHGCITRGTIVHELLHSLGFYHEHTRPDRDQYVKIIEENIQEGAVDNFQKLGAEVVESYGIDYDYNSIMHYCQNAFSVSKDKNTLHLFDPNAVVCNVCELSPLDILQINLRYKCDMTNPPPLLTPLPIKPSPPLLTQPFPNCGNTYDGILDGGFTSPGYAEAIYPHGMNCGWVLRAKEGYYIDFKLTISIEFTTGCTKDYVQAFYGSKTSRKYCGEYKLTFSRVIDFTLHYVTDASNRPTSRTYIGLTGEFTSIDIDECAAVNPPCSHGCNNTKGSYHCTCPTGLYLSSCNGQCLDINECDENVHECDTNVSTCKNNYGSYTCECKHGYLNEDDQTNRTCIKQGGISCLTKNGGCSHICEDITDGVSCSCRDGYILDSDDATCIDIDECVVNKGGCEHTCTNIDGTYECSCNVGFRLNGDNHTCADINECRNLPKDALCDGVCVNYPGGYFCFCNSRIGLTFGPNFKSCVDINECETDNAGCDQTCINTIGSYQCSCDTGFVYSANQAFCQDFDECSIDNGGCSHNCDNTIGSYECSCDNGYELASNGKTCQDYNECSTGNGECDHICNNTVGSYKCLCRNGFYLDSSGVSCQDIDECITDNGGCDQTCINNNGSYTCLCLQGYEINGDGKTCQDINECTLEGVASCSHTCTNTIGSYQCSCDTGFVLSASQTFCQDNNECSTGNGECDHICNNTVGSYKCLCRNGFYLDSNGVSCQDIDECITDNGGCDQTCINNNGSYTCLCLQGYEINDDGKTCQDINECTVEGVAYCSHTCINTQGSVRCTCPEGYNLTSDNKTCLMIPTPTPSTVSTHSTTILPVTTSTPRPPLIPCGANLTTESGVISYNDSSIVNDCLWTIKNSDTSKYFNLTIKTMNFIPIKDDCSECYVEIFNGGSDKSVLLGKYCNQTNNIQTAINEVTIRYRSTKCSGSFEISYGIVSEKRNIARCTTVVNSYNKQNLTQLVGSKNFPGNGSPVVLNSCIVYIIGYGGTIRFTVLYSDQSSDETACSSLKYYSSLFPSPFTLVSPQSMCSSSEVVTFEAKNYGLIQYSRDTTSRGYLGLIEIIY